MTKEEVCAQIEKIGVIPAIRVSSAEDGRFAAEAVNRGGIPIVEITMTVPGACALIADLAHSHPKMIVGAGTVLTTDTARMCLDSGARFLTAPSFSPALVQFAAKQNIVQLSLKLASNAPAGTFNIIASGKAKHQLRDYSVNAAAVPLVIKK